ncbi:MAG: TonB-dependent receptor domain-containing protein, partial [Halorhodospira sp.]
GAYQMLTAWLGEHQLQGSLRYDDDEEFGDDTTGQLAWGWQATDSLQARASYGTAFKAPTFNDLYQPGAGNPDLEPEASESYEVGMRGSYANHYWDLAAFQTEVDDLIDWVSQDPTDPTMWSPRNVDEARIRGAELEAGTEWQQWQLSGALTYLDHEDRGTGNELPRRPNQSVRIDIDRELGDLSLGATGIARGRSYDDAGNDTRLSGYSLLNLRTSYAITPDWTLRGTLENALDKDYETADGYNQPGRAVYVSLHFNQQ